jgi:hypothetical protein
LPTIDRRQHSESENEKDEQKESEEEESPKVGKMAKFKSATGIVETVSLNKLNKMQEQREVKKSRDGFENLVKAQNIKHSLTQANLFIDKSMTYKAIPNVILKGLTKNFQYTTINPTSKTPEKYTDSLRRDIRKLEKVISST